MMIAIDVPRGLYYEGQGMVGYPLWPAPFVSVATIIVEPGDYDKVPNGTDIALAALLFREDFFDPVTRIRRGRFYKRGDDQGQPHKWTVFPHPAIPSELASSSLSGHLQKQICGFHDWHFRYDSNGPGVSITVVLGARPAMAQWRIVGIEQISSGEDLVTLKARENLGVLPEIWIAKIPPDALPRVRECVERVLDTAYRAGPESVIDRCRDLCAAVLGAYFEQETPGSATKDLGDLVKIAARREMTIVENAGRLVARLHARTKPSEQQRYDLESPREADASLAIECTGTILRELKWAN